jgi:hypothetical protein
MVTYTNGIPNNHHLPLAHTQPHPPHADGAALAALTPLPRVSICDPEKIYLLPFRQHVEDDKGFDRTALAGPPRTMR